MYIAEQQMIARGGGHAGARLAAVRRPPSRRSSRAATTSSAWPRSAAPTCRLCGSHAGVSIGEDGPSQMGLEDLAEMRAIYGSTVLYPCDANQTAKLLAAMADQDGHHLHAHDTRQATQVIYGPDEEFTVGGSRVRALLGRRRGHDRRRRHHAARGAGGRRHAGGRGDRGPRDRPLLGQAARRGDAARGGRAIGPSHHRRGPLAGGRPRRGGAVRARAAGCASTILAVREMPGSGKPDELLAAAGIDSTAIVATVKGLLS